MLTNYEQNTIALITLLLGCLSINYASNTVTEKELYETEILSKNAIKTEAICKDATKTKVKIDIFKTTLFYLNYQYAASNKTYKYEITSSDNKVKAKIDIWYNRKNPGQSSEQDPIKKLKELKTKKVLNSKDQFEIIGGLLALASGYYLFKKLKRLFFELLSYIFF